MYVEVTNNFVVNSASLQVQIDPLYINGVHIHQVKYDIAYFDLQWHSIMHVHVPMYVEDACIYIVHVHGCRNSSTC